MTRASLHTYSDSTVMVDDWQCRTTVIDVLEGCDPTEARDHSRGRFPRRNLRGWLAGPDDFAMNHLGSKSPAAAPPSDARLFRTRVNDNGHPKVAATVRC
jgi:hypothetical protein